MSHASPKLHNAMWPGLVGKGSDEGQEPPISLDRMLELTAAAEVDGQKFDGIDLEFREYFTEYESIYRSGKCLPKLACFTCKVL